MAQNQVTQAEFRECQGEVCPKCGDTRNVQPIGKLYINEDQKVMRKMVCISCGDKWFEIYVIAGYTHA